MILQEVEGEGRRVTISFIVPSCPQLAISWLFLSHLDSFEYFWILLESSGIFWILLESIRIYCIIIESLWILGAAWPAKNLSSIFFCESLFWNLLESFGIFWNLFQSFVSECLWRLGCLCRQSLQALFAVESFEHLWSPIKTLNGDIILPLTWWDSQLLQITGRSLKNACFARLDFQIFKKIFGCRFPAQIHLKCHVDWYTK